MDEVGRAQIIAEVIERSWVFEDAEVPLYLVLIKTTSKRYWTVSDLGKQAALINAAKGILTFEAIGLSEEDIAVMTQHYEDPQNMTAVFAT